MINGLISLFSVVLSLYVMAKEIADWTFKDFLSLDQRLHPLLGEYEKSGAHLRLLSVLTHSALTTGPKHQVVYPTSPKQAFLFLQSHKDEPFN